MTAPLLSPRTFPGVAAAPAPATAMRVVCGVDARPGAEDAVREACALAGPRGHVALVTVLDPAARGRVGRAGIASAGATSALERAMRQTRAAGVRSSAYILHNTDPGEALLRAAGDGDALVVGGDGTVRAAGFVLGGVTTAALHHAGVPVLVARPAPAHGPIVVASDGSLSSDAACELAAKVAIRGGSRIVLFSAADEADADVREELVRQTLDLTSWTGQAPALVYGAGCPADAIVDAAAGASLLVVGSTGRTGLHELGSVSERVAHRATCSVLVARRPRR